MIKLRSCDQLKIDIHIIPNQTKHFLSLHWLARGGEPTGGKRSEEAKWGGCNGKFGDGGCIPGGPNLVYQMRYVANKSNHDLICGCLKDGCINTPGGIGWNNPWGGACIPGCGKCIPAGGVCMRIDGIDGPGRGVRGLMGLAGRTGGGRTQSGSKIEAIKRITGIHIA